jgi:hypothetical protein
MEIQDRLRLPRLRVSLVRERQVKNTGTSHLKFYVDMGLKTFIYIIHENCPIRKK